jgi:hypothetical protein
LNFSIWIGALSLTLLKLSVKDKYVVKPQIKDTRQGKHRSAVMVSICSN